MDINQLKILFNILNKKIINLFNKWQSSKLNELEKEKFSEEYIKKVQKIIGKDINDFSQFNKFKNKLYNDIKVNIKNIIEYNFS